jgi:hypothetical protein
MLRSDRAVVQLDPERRDLESRFMLSVQQRPAALISVLVTLQLPLSINCVANVDREKCASHDWKKSFQFADGLPIPKIRVVVVVFVVLTPSPAFLWDPIHSSIIIYFMTVLQ